MKGEKMFFMGIILGLVIACATPVSAEDVPIDTASVNPGSAVRVKGETVSLYGGSLTEGQNFLEVIQSTDIEFPFKGRVTLVSIVPSLDTPVCEIQTYKLRTMKTIHLEVDIITISRDLPMAQARFARDHKIGEEGFVSDYKSGAFGKATGLMMKEKELLARGIMVLDQDGVIRHLQIVPEVSHLPDLEKAVSIANDLAVGVGISEEE